MNLLQRLFTLLVFLYIVFIFILYKNLQFSNERLPVWKPVINTNTENSKVDRIQMEDPKYRLKNVKGKRLNFNTILGPKLKHLLSYEGVSTRMGRESEEKCLGNQEDFSQIMKTAYFVVDYATFIYSAFLDNRTGIPKIRMMSMLRRIEIDPHQDLWCHFRHPDESGAIYFSSKVENYEMCENHKMLYGGWILSCELPDVFHTSPCHVVVSQKETHFEYWNAVSIPLIHLQNKNGLARKKPFGVCVPPLHGNVIANRLIEFIELNSILGAEHFTFYLYHVSDNLIPILRYYIQRGVVSVVGWQLPFTLHQHIWYYGQSVAINDCLYRNMQAFQYLAIIDLDEFIVPKGKLTSWNDIAETVGYSTSGFSFESAIFYDKTSNQNGSKSGFVSNTSLHTLTEMYRTLYFSQIRNKVMVNPSTVFELGIHHVSRWWTDKGDNYVTEVSPDIAFIHHYKKCQALPDLDCDSIVKDTSVPDKYSDRLRRRYSKVVESLNP